MFVTTWNNKDENANNMFIRLNQTRYQAVEDAKSDCNEALNDYYDCHVAKQVLDVVDGEAPDFETVVRIINPANGYEYEAYIIKDHPVDK